jgi:hypothetical protein
LGNNKTSDNSSRIDELQALINRCQLIVDNLEHNVGWEGVLEDFKRERQRLDDNWQFVTDKEKWIEWRATKMAVIKVLNVVEDYKMDMKTAIEEKFTLENPDKVIQADVDNS